MGGCWEKSQALAQIENLKKHAHPSESRNNSDYVQLGTYEIKEELVLPVGYTTISCETKSFGTMLTSKEVELLHQISDLKKQLSTLQKQVDQERLLNANPNDPVQFLWN
jgi:hypothetical protein